LKVNYGFALRESSGCPASHATPLSSEMQDVKSDTLYIDISVCNFNKFAKINNQQKKTCFHIVIMGNCVQMGEIKTCFHVVIMGNCVQMGEIF
jgi:hypothetical protein